MNGPIRCPPCGNWLGVRLPDGRVEIRHRGRRAVGRLDEIVCDKCGEIWRQETSEDRSATLVRT